MLNHLMKTISHFESKLSQFMVMQSPLVETTEATIMSLKKEAYDLLGVPDLQRPAYLRSDSTLKSPRI